MRIQVNISVLKASRWYQVATRFCLGGLITAAAGIVAKEYGAAVGGLFLAFPAIFGASATLIEKHERERKEKLALAGHRRGTDAAALDAAGASLGSIGLAAFGLSVWLLAPSLPIGALALGSVSWLLVSVSLWRLRRTLRVV